MKLKAHAITDIGRKRKINQDAFLSNDDLRLYVVADGMGGHRGGEVASKIAVETIQKFCSENKSLNGPEQLDQAINLSCGEIYRQAAQNDELTGMGTTVAALLFQEGTVYVGQVGDSRAYLVRSEGIWQMTEDHSLLNEELRSGRLGEGQAASYQFRNVITRSVGYESQVKVDVYRRKIQSGDIYLLCTDGLSGLIDINELQDHLVPNTSESSLKRLIDLANQRGGDDNITALAVKVE